MRRRIHTPPALSIFISVLLLASFSLYLSRDVFSGEESRPSPSLFRKRFSNLPLNFAVTENQYRHRSSHHVSSLGELSPDAILFPDWEVLLVLSPRDSLPSDSSDGYFCLFQNNATSPARPTGFLPFHQLVTFKCVLPSSVRRLRPFYQPILTKSPEYYWLGNDSGSPELLRWSHLAYESLSTENDVVLFAKGVNQRRDRSRPPSELRCVFGDDATKAVRTEVTISSQEVFRCRHPDEASLRRLFNGRDDERIKISLEVRQQKKVTVVPSLAYYSGPRKVTSEKGKSLVCACTMVYNVAKFLKEWVIYHSKIGVDKFILYDNGSDDGLEKVVEQLLLQGYDVKTLLWPWPKTQEAGFSHCAVYARDSCTWMMYVDVDEFVFSPSWLKSLHPSPDMLKSLLPLPRTSHGSSSSSSGLPIAQIMMRCLDFGPSNQTSHPIQGVTQGYTCRRKMEQRHKSIVLLEAVDTTLINVVHHFQLREGYRGKRLTRGEGVVNHYKYQAWSEFKAKFRRRVSAYVVDWRQESNPMSQDRTPGLGFAPIEPKGWATKFCEVNDSRLKVATQRWFRFGLDSPTGYKMAWQD
ncbi:PREDICTED: glycosyltransferase family 92 protein RCOM_0530710-like [Nelumbo nucifera]|uniref:Glycosyltransferase family 92 protein n=2 Tax=Nelumbo nucifera TaxID=4432 RepID=A0A822ZMV0_NELNU|nr:PREDICTED: glycosyltransferase family 92 protein RCOM_0530710-like [Nelumbo nucifera]DAD46552.1 TPA_asm: hypothetical protein HUJ06_016489 [Nelumbo nucifera]